MVLRCLPVLMLVRTTSGVPFLSVFPTSRDNRFIALENRHSAILDTDTVVLMRQNTRSMPKQRSCIAQKRKPATQHVFRSMVFDTVGAKETFRFCRRLALALALPVCADFLSTYVQAQTPTTAQTNPEPTVVGDVLISVPDGPAKVEAIETQPQEVKVASLPPSISGARILRFQAESEPEVRDNTTSYPAIQRKAGVIFSPIELRSIPVPVPIVHPPSDWEVFQNEIARRELESVFVDGMIDDDSGDFPPLPHPEPQVGEMKSPLLEKMPQGGRFVFNDTTLRLPALPIELGMIEDDNKYMVQLAPNLDTPAPLIGELLESTQQEASRPSQPLPNYALPGGGLDIYQLAPTRFHHPLPGTIEPRM